MAIKKQKPHSSARKKASKAAPKSSAAKKKAEQLKQRKKLEELTLQMFEMVYEDYQQGKFHRIL